MRLIDADALAEKLGINEECKNCQYYSQFRYRCIRYGSSFTDVCKAIYDAPTVQPGPEEIARDIATILENEQDMRVILKNAQPQRMRGRWEDAHRSRWDGTFYWFIKCPNCGYERKDDNHDLDAEYKFCPNCGARMMEGNT